MAVALGAASNPLTSLPSGHRRRGVAGRILPLRVQRRFGRFSIIAGAHGDLDLVRDRDGARCRQTSGITIPSDVPAHRQLESVRRKEIPIGYVVFAQHAAPNNNCKIRATIDPVRVILDLAKVIRTEPSAVRFRGFEKRHVRNNGSYIYEAYRAKLALGCKVDARTVSA